MVQLVPYWCQKNLPGLLFTPPEKYGKNCKTQLWDEKQNRALFLDHPVCLKSTMEKEEHDEKNVQGLK